MKQIKIRIAIAATLLTLATSISTSVANNNHIKIYPSLSKEEIQERMESVDWAKPILSQAHKEVDKYVEIHKSDTTWIISRLQMYWKNHYTQPYINGAHYSRGEGNAPVPTVRFTGGRDWASHYKTPALESIKPYMDYRDDQIYLQNSAKEGAPWEWVDVSETAHQVEKINVSIMNKAMYSAFLYWLSGEERYAKFAYDILKVFTDGIYYREAPIAEGDKRNAKVVGLTSFEVIHEAVVNPMTLCYDFLTEYLTKQEADTKRMHAVFQKFADQIIVNGVADNNWNVFQARFVTYLALLLDDDSAYENGKGQGYYTNFLLNKTVDRQRALKEVRDTYDPNTAVWNESPNYSVSTTKDLLETLLLLDGIERENILKEFEIVERAVWASLEYELPNGRMSSFGDNSYSLIDNTMFESLLTLYNRYGEREKEQAVMALLNDRISKGLYNRSSGASLYKLFNYVGELDPSLTIERPLYSSMFYAPNVNLTLLRSGVDPDRALMLVNAGTGFNHNNNNGMSMELYGKGYILGIDKGRGGSYWIANHHEYYKAAISHNTVIIDGVSTNSSREMKLGESSPQHKLLSAFPKANQLDADSEVVVAYTDNEFLERSTNSIQRRTNSIIRTSEGSGYYVDIFRSRKVEGGDKTHEYIYQNVAQSLTIEDFDTKPLELKESYDLTSDGGKAKGYDYLSDRLEAAYNGDLRATFELDPGKDRERVSMDVWMKGYEGRKIFSVMSPNPLKGYGGMFTKEIDEAKVPTLIVRQEGEAWDRPFVAIYEPSSQSEGRTIKWVTFEDEDDDAIGIEVTHRDGSREIISHHATETTYSVVSISAWDEVNYLFLGNGTELKWRGYTIRSVDGEAITVLIEFGNDGVLRATSEDEFHLELPRKIRKKYN